MFFFPKHRTTTMHYTLLRPHLLIDSSLATYTVARSGEHLIGGVFGKRAVGDVRVRIAGWAYTNQPVGKCRGSSHCMVKADCTLCSEIS